MITTNYSIQDIDFKTTFDTSKETIFKVRSIPRPYDVRIIKSEQGFSWLKEEIKSQAKPLVLIDRNIKENILKEVNLTQIPCLTIDATENNKDIMTVLKVCDFLGENGANRGSMLYVIGGGIIQDLGAFAGYMYKRGIPWTFIPTTLLSQADSCLGGKTAVNYGKTKNVLGLFSAPRQVIVDSRFVRTLNDEDRLSGCGEIFRLLVTGGSESFKFFQNHVNDFIAGSRESVNLLTVASLSVKKSIVEYDEFETDIRRSMNYGHSIGHAIEALSNYAIPHGQGVTIGILVENKISKNRGLLSSSEDNMIYREGRKIISENVWEEFKKIDPVKLLPFLSNDKKAEGINLKLATIESIGKMKFIDLPLNETGIFEVNRAIKEVIESE